MSTFGWVVLGVIVLVGIASLISTDGDSGDDGWR